MDLTSTRVPMICDASARFQDLRIDFVLVPAIGGLIEVLVRPIAVEDDGAVLWRLVLVTQSECVAELVKHRCTAVVLLGQTRIDRPAQIHRLVFRVLP